MALCLMTPRWHAGITRDLILFVFGLSGIAYETLLHAGPERPTLLAIFAAFTGLPIFLRADDRKRRRKEGEG